MSSQGKRNIEEAQETDAQEIEGSSDNQSIFLRKVSPLRLDMSPLLS